MWTGPGLKPWRNVLGSELDANDLLAGAFIRATWDDGRGAWVSEISSSPSFNAAFRTWSAGLPTSPAGLAPGEPWRNGDTIAFVPNP